MQNYAYGQKEMEYLAQKDVALGAFIRSVGKVEREVDTHVFGSLVSSIISQQISGKAAETVWGRLCTQVGEVTPAAIAALQPEALKACGMSMRKAQYIQGAALSGLDFERMHQLSDAEVIAQLSALRGVGVWTAEMLLIFCFARPDVVSFGDLGIRRGMMRLYGLETLSKEQFASYAATYSPHGTVASFYLWELAT